MRGTLVSAIAKACSGLVPRRTPHAMNHSSKGRVRMDTANCDHMARNTVCRRSCMLNDTATSSCSWG
jgi:hypothetical protein